MTESKQNNQVGIPQTTLETLARNFFRESSAYGFKQVDYVRFVNYILDRAMTDGGKDTVTDNTAESIREKEALLVSSKPIELPIKGERIFIRACDRQKDRSLFENWLADAYGRYFLQSMTTAKTMTVNQFLNNEFHIIGIISLEDRSPIGAMAFLNYDVMQFKAELRKIIGEPDMRGKGYGKEATQLWIRYGMETLDLKKIYLNTLDTNLRNIRLNEELGFRVEGILRNELFIDGEYRDVLRMGLWRT